MSENACEPVQEACRSVLEVGKPHT